MTLGYQTKNIATGLATSSLASEPRMMDPLEDLHGQLYPSTFLQ